MKMLWTTLTFRQSKHLLEKITCRIHFLMQFSQIFKKYCLIGLRLMLEQSGIIVFQLHLRAIEDLVFYSISNLLIFNNFLKNKN